MRWLVPLALACMVVDWPAPETRHILRSPSGEAYTVSMLDGGRTGLYYDVAEVVGQMRPEAQHVVLLGLGGGEMLRAARRTLPGADLVGVELSPELARVAVTDFHVQDFGVRVVVDDALEYVGRAPEGSVDGLLVDVYDDALLPLPFRTVSFFAACRRALSSRGVLLMNVYPAGLSQEVSSAVVAAGFSRVVMTQVGPNVMVLAER